ncbi:hypothetical protein EVAR_98328_1 [Eumeta japonica]|uniref:Uncharacterized protein n=1 Tax=Eumeta variegata TaxID=151549 RepID=A0A4C1X9E2_EUMVA|nr:hypothetical protein EVAR_98328_1 [Eumeta japonica]
MYLLKLETFHTRRKRLYDAGAQLARSPARMSAPKQHLCRFRLLRARRPSAVLRARTLSNETRPFPVTYSWRSLFAAAVFAFALTLHQPYKNHTQTDHVRDQTHACPYAASRVTTTVPVGQSGVDNVQQR